MECPKCKGTKLRKHGFVLKSDKVKEQRYQCLTCHYNFSNGARHRILPAVNPDAVQDV